MVYRARRYGPDEIARIRVVCNRCGAAVDFRPQEPTTRLPVTCPACHQIWAHDEPLDEAESRLRQAFNALRQACRLSQGDQWGARLEFEFADDLPS